MSNDSVLPCPLCGYPAEVKTMEEIHYGHGDKADVWRVDCTNDVCQLCLDGFASRDAVIAAWNQRTPAPPGDVPVGAHEQLVADIAEMRAAFLKLVGYDHPMFGDMMGDPLCVVAAVTEYLLHTTPAPPGDVPEAKRVVMGAEDGCNCFACQAIRSGEYALHATPAPQPVAPDGELLTAAYMAGYYDGRKGKPPLAATAMLSQADLVTLRALADLACGTQPLAPTPDWSQAPEWAEWWAVDANGVAVWYETQPEPLAAMWYQLYRYEINERMGFDWRETLQRRPQAQPEPPDAPQAEV